MRGDDHAQADALDRVWDTLVGRPGEPMRAGELDPDLQGVPARLAELERGAAGHAASVPDWSVVRDRMRRGTAATSNRPARGRARAAAQERRAWRAATRERRDGAGSGFHPGRRWWPPVELAIGVGVIVALMGVAFSWDLGAFRDDPSPPRAAVGGAPELSGALASPPAPSTTQTVAASTPAAPPSFDTDGDGSMNLVELATAVAATIPEFAFPPGYEVSAALIMAPAFADAPYRGSSHEMTAEQTILGGYHRCAWEQTWLDAQASGDEALAAEALAVMTEVIPYNVNNAPDTVAFFVEVARRAAAGDPSMVVQDVANNCKMEFLTPEGTLPATPEPGDGSPASPVELSAPGISWSPNELTVPQGGVIRLTNDGTGGPHNFIVQGYNDQAPVDMPPGSQTEITVPADLPPGTYTFYCSIPGHRALMEGSITILATD